MSKKMILAVNTNKSEFCVRDITLKALILKRW